MSIWILKNRGLREASGEQGSRGKRMFKRFAKQWRDQSEWPYFISQFIAMKKMIEPEVGSGVSRQLEQALEAFRNGQDKMTEALRQAGKRLRVY